MCSLVYFRSAICIFREAVSDAPLSFIQFPNNSFQNDHLITWLHHRIQRLLFTRSMLSSIYADGILESLVPFPNTFPLKKRAYGFWNLNLNVCIGLSF